MENKNTALIIWFNDLRIEDVPLVGGKNAALGEMFANLVPMGIRIPNGFAVTAQAYRVFMEKSGLKSQIAEILQDLNTADMRNLQKRGEKIRKLIISKNLPDELKQAITEAYFNLGKIYGANPGVAVRSSATAEDLPGASFAGQQETFLNINGIEAVLYAVKKCIASLFTDRAISYRTDKGFANTEIALSVGVQMMVRSDKALSGVAFSLDTETGFDKVVIINSSYGLGEMIVLGKVTPDEYIVFKPTLETGHKAIISRNLGTKETKMIYDGARTAVVKVPPAERSANSLTDDEILELARWVVKIEKYFSDKHGEYRPMDTEWAKDGITGELFIVQARPETVHAGAKKNIYDEYKLNGKGKTLVTGTAVGAKITTGKVHIILSPKQLGEFKKGEILVTEITDPDWEPIMKIASAIITDKGGRTSHAAIVSRELGIPCVVGTGNATKILKNGQMITVDCSSAVAQIMEGELPFEKLEHKLDAIPETRTKVMVNIGAPDEAFKHYLLPAKGVGLGRLEFIITEHIKIHPNALIDFEKLKNNQVDKPTKLLVKTIEDLTVGYADKKQFYVDELAEGVAKIAASFWPHPVIIRLSDFKTNEYRTLIGGDRYEPVEENPMIGWRGASRYYHPNFKNAFGLECQALLKVRQEMGLKNVIPMIPFCRTPEEGSKVIQTMAEFGLSKEKDSDLKIYVMCEIPSNILLADDFFQIFDGMSIGSNDLGQLTLGIDRDSQIVAGIANENNGAVKKLIAEIIKIANEKNKYIGICGQAPSDFPEFAQFLVNAGIQSISLNPDTVIKTLSTIAEAERQNHQ
ncbi:MAG: phosphoenolpyruvate synthase [Patescibacteria group bacterium]